MRGLGKFKLLAVAAALGILLAVTGGLAPDSVLRVLVISQAAGRAVQRPRSISPRSKDVGHWTLDRFKAEVFNLSGKRLFDSGPTMGNTLDWNMSSESGERAAQGVHLPSAQFSSDIALQDLTPKIPWAKLWSRWRRA